MIRARRSWWVPATVLGALLGMFAGARVGAAPPVLPDVHDDGKPARPGLLPPPPTADAEGETEGGPDDTQSEEQRLAQRVEEFNLHLAKGQAAHKKDRWDEAIREFIAALDLQPGDPAALLGLAEARHARTSPGRCPQSALKALLALETYDPRGVWPEQRLRAIEWMAECGDAYAQERLSLLRELANEEPGSAGRPDDIRLTLARVQYDSAGDQDDADRAITLDSVVGELSRYRSEREERKKEVAVEALRLLGDIHHERGAIEDALAAYRELLTRYPASEDAERVDVIVKDLELEKSLRELEKTQGFAPAPEADAAYARGEEALRGGDVATAESELDLAISMSPWFPRAYHLRGVVHARNRRFQKAVEDLKRAVWMDRSDYEAHIKLAMIYKKEFAGAEDDQAIAHLESALRLRPDLDRLHLLLGELHARSNRQKAREHYTRYVELASLDDPDVEKARQAIRDLEREIRQDAPASIPPPPEKSLRLLDPRLRRLLNEAYVRGTEHQDWAEAERILLQAQVEFADQPIVLNQLARVVYAQGRGGDAHRYWAQSLTIKEDQMEVHEQLGLLLRAPLPDKAIEHLRRAADLGSSTARYVLAELLWNEDAFLEASEQLQLYIDTAGDYDLFWDRAQELRKEIDARFLQFYLGSGALLVILTVWPSVRLYRRYRGAPLGQLLVRQPKSFPEVARILSLIRHEILKHNTAFLADVGRAIEYGEPDADLRAEVLARRMFGDGGEGRHHPGGIYGRFRNYLGELEQVGRAHRVVLNLVRKDPIFRPMIAAFDELAARADDIRDSSRLRPGRRMELAKLLGRSGHVLGRQAFEQLSGLIQRLCVVDVDLRLLQDVYDQVAGEEQFAGTALAPLALSGRGAPVRIFRTDLEDILANVIRNSLRSSLSYARPPVGLGLELSYETDEITGLSSLAIRVKDRSPEQLSNEMLRGRYVERGMGITVDLLSRYDGAIAVEHEPGWNKAVVLRFFVVEEEGARAVGAAA